MKVRTDNTVSTDNTVFTACRPSRKTVSEQNIQLPCESDHASVCAAQPENVALTFTSMASLCNVSDQQI